MFQCIPICLSRILSKWSNECCDPVSLNLDALLDRCTSSYPTISHFKLFSNFSITISFNLRLLQNSKRSSTYTTRDTTSSQLSLLTYRFWFTSEHLNLSSLTTWSSLLFHAFASCFNPYKAFLSLLSLRVLSKQIFLAAAYKFLLSNFH